jgi:HD-GYP domain-containing protein (c-di-GMP phosphodiesterase class II)
LARNRSNTSPSATGGRPPKEEARPTPVPLPSRAELAAAFSQALDLAEGRQAGHAARVCYIASNLLDAAEATEKERRAVYYAALLHDAGAAPATSEICRLLNIGEEVLFAANPGQSPQQRALEIAPFNAAAVVAAMRAHLAEGAKIAKSLGFDASVQQAIAAHHERWDGKGYPLAQKEDAIPLTGRVVGAADLIESLISAEQNTLAARRNMIAGLAEYAGNAIDPALCIAARELVRSDEFWLGLHSCEEPAELSQYCPDDPAQRSPSDLVTFATVFAALADAKGEHTDAHSVRTSEVAVELAEALGMPEERRDLLRIAGLLHDVGLLGVPARIIAKPDILSLTEMESMRKHPAYSQQALEGLPGVEEVAQWVGAHHERPDGRGYPEMHEDASIPREARLLAIADTYVALTSHRPYRKALSHDDALQVLLGGAGTQHDPKLVQTFFTHAIGKRAEATSSRTVRRSRQKQ